MGWNDRDDRWIDLSDETRGLEEYYSEVTGKDIHISMMGYEEFFIETPRTGREYFPSLQDVDRRLKQLYEDILPDDGDYSDPYEGL